MFVTFVIKMLSGVKKNVITTSKLLINYMYVLLLHKTDVTLLIKIVSKLMGWVFLNIID